MRRLSLFALLAFSACPSVNPDAGRFSCATSDDCGGGYDCIAQFDGGALCFRSGTCDGGETCNGADENCDGRVDETFPEASDSCTTSQLGVCSAGIKVCVAGGLDCAATKTPSAELCNRLDDDCDGQTDETFDLATDSMNCGMCGHVCPAGTACFASTCHETRCDDGLDNDGNGQADCLDEACFDAECLPGSVPPRRCGRLTADAGVGDAGVEPDGGAAPARCFLPESDCANGLDDDGDGRVDCADVDCDGRTCSGGLTCVTLSCR